MSAMITEVSPQTTRILRLTGWLAAALFLAMPAIAMQFTSEVKWTAGDFVFTGGVFALVGGIFELTARASKNIAYRFAVVLAVASALLQIWINLAVGIIGNEDNPANWTYFAVVGMAASGAIVALASPRELARAMLVAAGAQVLFSVVHAMNGTPTPFIDAFFAALWIAAARLFAKAERQRCSEA